MSPTASKYQQSNPQGEAIEIFHRCFDFMLCDALMDRDTEKNSKRLYRCGDNRKCKNKADRKMVKSLDAIPYNERQWGHWLARNLINTKQKLGLGLN